MVKFIAGVRIHLSSTIVEQNLRTHREPSIFSNRLFFHWLGVTSFLESCVGVQNAV